MNRTEWSLLLILSLLWGGSCLFVELARAGLTPLSLVWGRVGLAAVILWAVLQGTGAPAPPRAVWPALLVMGLLNNAVPFTLFALAQGQITGALASVLNAMTPLFTVLAAHLATTDERLTPAKALGVGLGFAGVAVMMLGESLDGAVPAMLACLCAAVSYALASVWGRRFRRVGVAPLATAFGQVAASTVLITPVWVLHDQPWQMPVPGAGPLLAVLGLAGLSTALAYLLYFRVLASAGATAISLVTFLIPLSAAGLGWLVLDERLELRHLAGLAFILAGLVLTLRQRRVANVR